MFYTLSGIQHRCSLDTNQRSIVNKDTSQFYDVLIILASIMYIFAYYMLVNQHIGIEVLTSSTIPDARNKSVSQNKTHICT